MLDNQVLIDYITGTLGGSVGEEYDNPYGQGRITIVKEKPGSFSFVHLRPETPRGSPDLFAHMGKPAANRIAPG
jgi:hypothetical protein